MIALIIITILVLAGFVWIKFTNKKQEETTENQTINPANYASNSNVELKHLYIDSFIRESWQYIEGFITASSTSGRDENVRLYILLHAVTPEGEIKYIKEKYIDETYGAEDKTVSFSFPKSHTFYDKVMIKVVNGNNTLSAETEIRKEELE